MTRIVLTGGTGFVGANVARALVGRGFEVHLLNRESYASWRIEHIRRDVAIHLVDLTDAPSVKSALAAIRPEQVFHLTQYGGYSWQADVGLMIQTNYMAGINLLHAAEHVGARVFINTGSSSEYGLRSRPTVESDCPEPNSDYAATKVAFTLYCQQWARRTGGRAPTLRLYSVYGPFEEPMRLMPRLLSYGLDNCWPPLVTPDGARDFVYIDDVVDSYLRAAAADLPDPGGIYNICSGRQATIRDTVDVVRRLLGVEAEPSWHTMPPRAWDTNIWYGDPGRAARELGWRATTTLQSGLKRFADWLQREPGMRAWYRQMTRDMPSTTR